MLFTDTDCLRIYQEEVALHQPLWLCALSFRVLKGFLFTQLLSCRAACRYASVLAVLPSVLCLAESRLWHLVEALSSESKTAFKDAGLSCPPWRDASTVLDKWLGRQPQDVAVNPDMTLQQLRLALPGQGSSSGGGGRGGQQ
jgi:hypothetical protein